MSDLIGQTLGRYSIVARLGRGGMADVYQAYQPSLSRYVAIKILHSHLAEETDFVARFEREAAAVARLRHPNIVQMFDFDVEGDLPYMVMEFIEGPTLKAELEERKSRGTGFSLVETARIFGSLGSAIDYAHGRGMVHRDLKPANVMFTADGQAVLTDFGIAFMVGPSRFTPTGAIAGTPAYMSPEQGKGEPVGGQSDIYSLGVILYEMVTGRIPFDADTPFGIIMKHINEPLPPPRSVNPQVSEAVEGVILRAMSKRPADRFPTAEEMALALAEAAGLTSEQRLALAPISTVALTRPVVQEAIPPEEAAPLPPCPYRGLYPFREEDSPFFYGREAFTDRLVEAVDRQPLTAVIGPSGSGKSSVVFAGLLPSLRQGEKLRQAQQKAWLLGEFRPGGRPFYALAAALLPMLEENLTEIDLLAETRKLARALDRQEILLQDVVDRALERNPGADRFLLVADQFEELYALCPDAAIRRSFMEALLAPGQTRSRRRPSFSLVITLRADFYGHALAHRPFADALQDAGLILGPMTRQELRQAIEGPALMQGVDFEAGLVERILNDVGDEPGNLPLLEFALALLWEQQARGQLTHTAYEAIGRVEGAVARYADQVYHALEPGEQEDVRRILVQMVRPGEGTEDTRRLATRSEFSEHEWELIQDLADARLVVTGRDATSDQETVEVVHEALIRGWGRLQDWMDADRAFRTWQERLRAAARQWERSEHDEGALLRGAPLAEAEGWLLRRGGDLSTGEAHFVRSGVALREREEKERESQRQRELEAARQLADVERQRAAEQAKAARQLRRRALLLAGALVVAAVLAVLAVGFGRRSQQDARRADANASAAEAANTLAIAERSTAQAASTRAVDERATAEAASTLAIDQKATAQANAVALATSEAQSNLRRQAAEDANALAQLRGLEAQARQLGAQAELVYDQQGRLLTRSALLAVESLRRLPVMEGNAAVHQVLSLLAYPEHVFTYNGSLRALANTQLAFSPDGRWLAWGRYGGAHLWNLTSGEEVVWPVRDTNLWDVAFSADSRLVAAGGSDAQIHVWDTGTGQQVAQMDHTGEVRSLAFGPEGYLLAAAGDKLLQVWSVELGSQRDSVTVQELAQMEHEGRLWDVAFSPDGRWLATASGDPYRPGEARVWEAVTGSELVRIPHDERVTVVAFSPDGALLGTGGDDETARVWDLSSGQELARAAHPSDVICLAFSPDGQRVASGSWDGMTSVWEATTGLQVAQMQHEDRVTAAVFSPDGRWLATSSWDETARLWDAVTGIELARMGHEGQVLAIAFSPDGQWLATGGDDRTTRLWRAAPAGEAARMEHGGVIGAVAYSPDGRWLATGAEDRTLRLWEAEAGREALRVELAAKVDQVAFSPDGQWLVEGTTDGTARVWKLTIGADGEIGGAEEAFQIGAGFDEKDICWSLELSPDGRRLATGMGWLGESGYAQIWDLATGQEMTRLEHDDAVSGVAFSPDGLWLATGSHDRTTRVWEVATGREVFRLQHDRSPQVILFSPDGLWLVTASAPGPAFIWEADTGEPVGAVSHGGYSIEAVAFSPDGRWLATAALDNTARVWDTVTLQEVFRVLHDGWVSDAAFSSDGERLVTRSLDGTARVWEVGTGYELARMDHGAALTDMALSPDGGRLATGCRDNIVRVWYLRPEDLIGEACARLTRNMTLNEWHLYLRGEPYGRTCPHLPVHTSVIKDALERSRLLVEAGDLREASDLFAEAVAWAAETEDVEINHLLCRQGGLYGLAALALPACDLAVALDAGSGPARDSRGLCRALTGDYSGASQDFRFFVEWLAAGEADRELMDQRMLWIDALDSGRTPLDEETLEMLRNE